MLINCHLTRKFEVVPLVKAGADIFYTEINGELIFGSSDGIYNRRPWKAANFNSLSEFKETVRLVQKYNKKIYLTINSHFYSQDQINKIITFISHQNKINGYIVADIGLILALKKRFNDIFLIASTGAHILNSKAIDFYLHLGVSEIIIPRHFHLAEIKELIADYPKIKFHYFIKNQDCANIDGLCSYLHRLPDSNEAESPCSLLCNFKIKSRNKLEPLSPVFKRLNNYGSIMFNECRACLISELCKIGVSTVKIVGRDFALRDKLKDVIFIKSCLKKTNLPQNIFKKRIQKDYKLIYGKNCGMHCLYH